MADRPPNFPMHPSNFAPNGMARPPQGMLHPQGQQSDGSAGNGLTDARLWAGQQITPMQLQQLQQMQQQQRSNPDLLGNNNPPAQMGDFGRSQHHAMNNMQQHMGQAQNMLQQSQPFNLTPHLPGQDPSSSSQQFQAPNMATMHLANGNNMSFNTAPAALQAAFNPRNPALMAQAMQNPHLSRQLERIAAGPTAGNTALNRMNALGQRPPAFNPGAMANGQSMLGVNAQQNPNMFDNNSAGGIPNNQRLPGQPGQASAPTPELIKERAYHLREIIMREEAEVAQLQQNRTSRPEFEVNQQLNAMRASVQEKKTTFQKLIQFLNAVQKSQLSGGGSMNGLLPSLPPGGGGNPSPHMQPSQQPPMNGQNGLWQSSNNPGAPAFSPNMGGFGNSSANAGMPNMQQNNTLAMDAIKQIQQRPPMNLAQPPLPSHSNNMGTASMPPNVAAGISNQSTGSEAVNVPPVGALDFAKMYPTWVKSHNIHLDERIMEVSGRRVDIYQLHMEVMNAGGFESVNRNDQWEIIGGKMGYCQFPAPAGQPAKAGPANAQQIAHIYREYLFKFEQAYASSWRNRNAAMTGGGAPPTAGQQPLRNVNVAALAQYAQMTTDEMRAMHLPEHVIRQVDSWRPYALRFKSQQQREMAARNGMGAASMNAGPNGGNAAGFPSVAGAPASNPERTLSQSGHQLPNMVNGASSSGQAIGQRTPPTTQELTKYTEFINGLKATFVKTKASSMKMYEMSDGIRQEFTQILTRLLYQSGALDAKAPIFYHYCQHSIQLMEEFKRLLGIIACAQHQEFLLRQTPPKYILEINTLKGMLGFAIKFPDTFKTNLQMASMQQAPALPADVINMNIPMPNLIGPSPVMSSALPSTLNPPIPLQPPPARRKPSVSNPGRSPAPASTPTPVPSAISPAPGPLAAPSPKTPKSPKVKPKPRPVSNKPTPPSAKPVAATTPAASAPETPSSSGSKRPREEDSVMPASSLSLEPVSRVPSPKRQKPDWSGPPSEELVQRQSQFDAVQSLDDAVNLFDLFNSDSLPADLVSTLLNMGGQSMLDTGSSGSGLSLFSGLTSMDSTAVTEPAQEDLFSAFIDLSAFASDDAFTALPELVNSNSTEPSPESDATLANTPKLANAMKTEPTIAPAIYDDDPLRLGAWAEIGAEAAHYQPNDGWKWSGTMPSADWAILQS